MEYDIVRRIVKENFSLGEDGQKSFEKCLTSKVKEFSFLDENQRHSYKIDKELYPYIDDGFNVLCHLKLFIRKYSISFDNYSENKVTVSGNKIKLFKLAVDFYSKMIENEFLNKGISENDCEVRMAERVAGCLSNGYIEIFRLIGKLYKPSEFRAFRDEFKASSKNGFEVTTSFLLKKIFEKIGCYKIDTTKDLYLVLSRNFNDFFLCSNGEGWTSCLNPESASGFWSCLPFLATDKNRCLCFISDLSEKEYLGIKSLRMFKRSWGELDTRGVINAGIFYPAKEYISDTFFEKMNLYNTIRNIEGHYNSMYPLDIFYNKYDTFDFLYQDDTMFDLEREIDKIFLRRGSKNHTIIVKGYGIRDYHMTSFKEGLKNLIDSNKQLSDFPGLHFCGECYKVVDENSKISYTLATGEEKKTCYNCLTKYLKQGLIKCENCGDTLTSESIHTEVNGEDKRILLCNHCHRCASCSKIITDKDIKIYKGYKLCPECFSEREARKKEENMFESGEHISSEKMYNIEAMMCRPMKVSFKMEDIQDHPTLEEPR